MIDDHFRATGACDAAQALSDLFSVSLQGDDIQDLGTRLDQALLSAGEVPMVNVLASFLQDENTRVSVQLQTVLATYDLEIDRKLTLPSCQRLKTMARRHIDQMIKMRNFRAWNGRIETWISVQSQ